MVTKTSTTSGPCHITRTVGLFAILSGASAAASADHWKMLLCKGPGPWDVSLIGLCAPSFPPTTAPEWYDTNSAKRIAHFIAGHQRHAPHLCLNVHMLLLGDEFLGCLGAFELSYSQMGREAAVLFL